MKASYDLVVVGGGIAGLSAAEAFAEAMPGARTALLNGEERAPYKRTAISKHLRCGYGPDEFALHPEAWFAERRIEVVPGRAVALKAAAKRIDLQNGDRLSGRALVLATGALPRQVWGDATHVVRSAGDGERLIAAGGRSAIVVGGGVLGVEVAEQLCRRGLAVTVIDRGGFLMPRRLNRNRGTWLTKLFASHGITCVYDRTVERVGHRPDGRLEVRSADAGWMADLVVECMGTRPDLQLAGDAGLHCDTGIGVDRMLETSVPGIFAAGDCVQLPNGEISFLWHQAEAQGRHAGINAAHALLGLPLHAFANLPRRLKSEPFGTFLFSIGVCRRGDMDRLLCCEHGDIYQEFGFRQNQLHTVVMTGDKARAKAYEKAVWAQSGPGQVQAELAVGALHSAELA